MALTTELVVEYGNQQIVKDRTKSALLYWSGYVSGITIPTEKPEESWVRQRILADRIARTPDNYIQPVMGYYIQDANIQTNMRDLMDGFPTDTEETTYAGFMELATSAQMSRFAETEVTDQQVQDWYNENGFGAAVQGQAAKPAKKIVVLKPPAKKAA